MKGPKEKKRLVETATAQQIFGRAGRPQFDNEGFVYALAHEDDVRILRWKEKYDSIPEDTKDPKLLLAKKQLKKKMPKRRDGETYWTAAQFEQLRTAASAKLSSRGDLPWRLLAYMLLLSPDVQPLREMVGRRLMTSAEIEKSQKRLNRMLIVLHNANYVRLVPAPSEVASAAKNAIPVQGNQIGSRGGMFAGLDLSKLSSAGNSTSAENATDDDDEQSLTVQEVAEVKSIDERFNLADYRPEEAIPTEELELLLRLRSVNPLFGNYLSNQLLHADRTERILALESLLELPANVAAQVRVPPPDELPFGPLAQERLHPRLLELGLATVPEIMGKWSENDDDDEPPREEFGRRIPPPWPLSLGEKLRRLFHYDVPGVDDAYARGVWVVGELLEFGGDFFKYISARGLQKQEGIIFRHVLRFIMLCDEFASIPPLGSEQDQWEDFFDDLIEQLSNSCRAVDAQSTNEALENKLANDELLQGAQHRTLRRT
jgi:hypothetical protein